MSALRYLRTRASTTRFSSHVSGAWLGSVSAISICGLESDESGDRIEDDDCADSRGRRRGVSWTSRGRQSLCDSSVSSAVGSRCHLPYPLTTLDCSSCASRSSSAFKRCDCIAAACRATFALCCLRAALNPYAEDSLHVGEYRRLEPAFVVTAAGPGVGQS